MSKLKQNRLSVENLLKLIDEIIENPTLAQTEVEILNALSSQSALAKYSNSKRSIHPISLNTLKAISNQFIPGAFASLDNRRKKARELLLLTPLSKDSNSRSRKSLEEKISLLETIIKKQDEDLFHLTRAYWRALSDGRSYALRSKDELIIAECAQNEEVTRGMASLMSRRLMEVVK